MSDAPPDIAKLQLDLEKLPGPQRVTELSRLADEGSDSARSIFNRLFRQVDGLSRSLFNVTNVARDQIVSELAGESYAVRKAIEDQMDEKIAEFSLQDETNKDPLKAMYSEILVVAWLDAMRCTLSVSRGGVTASDQQKLEANADRACRRFSKLVDRFTKLK